MTTAPTRRIRVSGGELSALDVGDRDAPPVLLIHGYPTSSFLWRSFVPSLATELRVLAIDLCGAGASEKPPGVALDADAQAGYVRELAGALGVTRFAVVAHGDGGTVAQSLAVDGAVDALVLIDSAGGGTSPAAAIERSVNAAREPEALISEALRRGSARPDRISQDAIHRYGEAFAGPGGAAALTRWAEAAAAYPPGLEARLSGLGVATFLLWGEDDPFVPVSVAEALNERIETSSLALLPGCGHFLPEEAAPTIVPLVAQWLGGRYLGRTHSHAHGPLPIRLDPRRSEEEG